MAPKTITALLISGAALGAFVFYFGTSLPDSIPDCHSGAAREEIEAILAKTGSGEAADGIRMVREIGRTFDTGGRIETYNCEVVVRASGGPDVFRVQLRGEGDTVSARLLDTAERL